MFFSSEYEDDGLISNFQSNDIANAVGVFLIAERGAASTIDRNPTQDQYRSSEEWEQYRANLRAIGKSKRKYFPLCQPPDLSKAPPIKMNGYRFLGRLKRDL